MSVASLTDAKFISVANFGYVIATKKKKLSTLYFFPLKK